MAESFRKACRVSPREESRKVCRLRRVTPQQLDGVLSLEDTWHLVTGEQHGDLAGRCRQPLHKLALGVRVGSVHFIQHQTHRHLVSSKEGRNTACILTRLGQRLNIRKTTEGSRGIQLKCLESTGPRGRKRKRCLPNSRRAMEKEGLGVRRTLEIGAQTCLDLRMSDNAIKELRAFCFTPHSSLFVGV